jgi:hypothetical protein
MLPKIAEAFTDSDEPLAPLDLRDVDFDGIRLLACAVLDRAWLDAARAPREAMSEVRRGG